MGRSPCCEESSVKKGPWTPEEDRKLVDYIQKHGHASWRSLPKSAGLNRCGKSCRLRWTNYLRPDIKRGKFTEDEERLIIHLHSILGNKWSTIATHLQGRTDNEIKNYWNTHIRKKLLLMGIDPVTHQRRTDLEVIFASFPTFLSAAASIRDLDTALRQVQADATHLARLQVLQQLLQTISSSPITSIGAVNAILSSPSNSQMNNFSQCPTNGAIPSVPGLADLCISNPVDKFEACPEQEMVQQMSSSVLFSSYELPTAASPQAAATAQVQDFTGSSYPPTPSEPTGVPNLCSLENDISWKDILDQISWPCTL